MAPNTETRPIHNSNRTRTLSSFSRAALYALAVFRPLVGVAFVFAPTVLRKAFIPGEHFETTSIFLPRLVGIREIVIGSLLWKALRRRGDNNHEEVHRFVLANLAIDLMDAASAGAAIVAGKSTEHMAAGWFGAGAILFVLLGLLGLVEY